jgi:2,5-diamino-6-(ribosylamino)-4(3H)-pyrimidinone 5'-phosphate reductase
MQQMQKRDRPHVVLQMVASIDGRIAFGPGLTQFDDPHPASDLIPNSDSIWKKVSDAIEAEWHPQGSMFGSRTFQRENAPLLKLPDFEGDPQSLYDDFLPKEVIDNTRDWAILVDGQGRGRSGYKATENPGGHILHLVSYSAPIEYLAFLRRKRIPYLIGGQQHADLKGALCKLRGTLGVRTIRLFGGGTLNGVMLRAGLIDQIHLVVWPMLLGGNRTPTLADCNDLLPGEQPAVLKLVSAQAQEDGHLWLHYEVVNN